MNRKQITSTISIAAIIGVILISVPNISAQSDDLIPSWVKIIAGSWHKGEVSDATFLDAMTSLIEKEIIIVPGYSKIVQPLILDDYVLTVTTNKSMYIGTETMIISGTLPDYGSSSVAFMLISPSDMIVTMTSAISNGNGEYVKTMMLGNRAMTESGTYTLVVNYQGERIETTILYDVVP